MSEPIYQWAPLEWPDPMQDLRDKAASGDKIAALVCERVDKAVEAVIADVKPKWEALLMEDALKNIADGK
ncbi:hypothetical protein [Caulobacter sp. UC70_42]|uniref:hypothetical protein n=1 Tax=Caulobacter sp. UC70_42 TaxID=3374551 RepID=UPI00375681E3